MSFVKYNNNDSKKNYRYKFVNHIIIIIRYLCCMCVKCNNIALLFTNDT